MRNSRISFAYKFATQVLSLYTPIWLEYGLHLKDTGKTDEAISLLRSACDGPKPGVDVSAPFLLAELYESCRKPDEMKAVFEKLLGCLDEEISKLSSGKADEAFAPSDILAYKTLQQQITLAFIQFVKAVRRVEGIKNARQVFSRARKNPHCLSDVYVYAGLMEFHCCKDPTVASKIFELAFKKFSEEPQFVAQYLRFLIQIGDDANTRAIFERSIQVIPSETTGILWDTYLEYEARFGDDFETLKRLIQRKSVGNVHESLLLTERSWAFGDLTAFNESTPHKNNGGVIRAESKTNAKSEAFFPETVTSFLKRLPSAHAFDGPVFDVDVILDVIVNVQIPEEMKRKIEQQQQGIRLG